MRTIHKYTIARTGMSQIPVRRGAQLLDVQIQNDAMCIWAEVDTDADYEERAFLVFGTGWEMPMVTMVHIATVQDGPFVWHVYEVKQ